MSDTFPPTGPTGLTTQIPAYLYGQYADDEDLQAFFQAFNDYGQAFLNWFVTLNLPIYTGLSGYLLDWVAQGVYGISRPALAYGSVTAQGAVNTFAVNTLAVNAYTQIGSIDIFVVNDDIFKRIITWFFFKGDGQQYSTLWLKRRIMRFLIGANGTAPNIDNTYPISVTYHGAGAVTVAITATQDNGITVPMIQTFEAAVSSGAISLPFQLTFTITYSDETGTLGLVNTGGVLQLAYNVVTPYPRTSAGAPGSLWSNGGVVSVVPGYTPVAGPPVYFGQITDGQLLAMGAIPLPTSNPGAGTGQLYVDPTSEEVWVA